MVLEMFPYIIMAKNTCIYLYCTSNTMLVAVAERGKSCGGTLQAPTWQLPANVFDEILLLRHHLLDMELEFIRFCISMHKELYFF